MSEYIIDTDGYYEISIGTVKRDGTPVVRCKDCKHFAHAGYRWDGFDENNAKHDSCVKFSNFKYEYFRMYWFEVEPYDFCAWGERKE